MRSEDDVIDLNPAHSGPLAEVAQDRNFVGQEVNLEGVGGQTAGLGAVTATVCVASRVHVALRLSLLGGGWVSVSRHTGYCERFVCGKERCEWVTAYVNTILTQ